MVRFRGGRKWRKLVYKQLSLLFELAEKVKDTKPDLAKHYVQMARRIVVRTRVRLPRELRHRFCHQCGTLFRPGVNCRIRLRRTGGNSALVITCKCGYRRKIVWKRRAPIRKTRK